MRLLLIRHGDASNDAIRDFDRELTTKGRKQAERAGKLLTSLNIIPDVIYSSPLVRAWQTAEILQQQVDSPDGVVDEERLACGMRPDEAYAILFDRTQEDTVALVGHEPDFSTLAADITSMENSWGIEIKKASVALFEVETPKRGGATLNWLITQKLIGGL